MKANSWGQSAFADRAELYQYSDIAAKTLLVAPPGSFHSPLDLSAHLSKDNSKKRDERNIMYPVSVVLTLIGMITAGAGRIVAVKIYYQIQLEESRPVTPLFVTLLYLVGQTLSLLVHFVYIRLDCINSQKSKRGKDYDTVETAARKLDDNTENTAFPPKTVEDEEQIRPAKHDIAMESDDDESIKNGLDQNVGPQNEEKSILNSESIGIGLGNTDGLLIGDDELRNEERSILDLERIGNGSNQTDGLLIGDYEPRNEEGSLPDLEGIGNESDQTDELLIGDDEPQNEKGSLPDSGRRKMRRRGSKTGLTSKSEDAIAWIHRIPWYLKPGIPGFFNLCNSALRWACLVYVAASTAEILISGLELVLSSFAARIIRKRIISTKRWIGVSIITLGIIFVGFAKLLEKKESEKEEHELFVGNLLIFGQCIFSVLQDLSEEIFMQEANFPATLLLGMEGLFGLMFGIPIYIFFFAEEISFTRSNIEYEIGLVFLVLITGILNIRTTEVTSSMTRNVWKQFRIILVWIFGLSVYYIGSGARFGEPWVSPDSFFILGGFSVILTGVSFYYNA